MSVVQNPTQLQMYYGQHTSIHFTHNINIMYSICKQTYHFTRINILYFFLLLPNPTLLFIIINTAYSISSALTHIDLCIVHVINVVYILVHNII